MATIYVDSNSGAVPYLNKFWNVGDKMVPTLGTTADHGKSAVWECTVAGNSTATPTWPASAVTYDVTTITQNGVVWIARAPTSWANAYPGLHWAVSNENVRMVGEDDYILMASNHVSSYGGTIVFRFPLDGARSVRVLSVNRTTGVMEYGAREIGNTNISLQFVGQAYIWGVEFRAGTGGSGTQAIMMNNGNEAGITFDNCFFWLRNTSGASYIQPGTTNVEGSVTRLLNCTYRFDAVGQAFVLAGKVEMRNVRPDANTVTVNEMFTDPAAPGVLHASSCDFSPCTDIFAVTATANGYALNFANCKFADNFGTTPENQAKGFALEAFSCSTGDGISGYTFQDHTGLIRESITVTRNGGAQTRGASGDLVSYSLQMVGGPGQDRYEPLYSPWIAIYNPTIGLVDVAMYAAYDSDTQNLSDVETWLEIEYYEESTSPLGKIALTAPVVAGTQSRDTEVAGTQIPLDGVSTWADPGSLGLQKIKLNKTVNAQQCGFIRVRVGHASPLPLYVDPKIILS